MQTGATSGYIPVSDASGVMTWTDPATITTSSSAIAIDDLTDGSDGLGADNVFLGEFSGAANIAGGDNNTGVGISSMPQLTTGDNNTALGKNTLINLITGLSNTAIGNNSSVSTTANYNSALGANTLFYNSTGSANTALGYNSMYNSTIGNNNNIAIGMDAMKGVAAYTNSSWNIATGYRSLYSISGGDYNIATGDKSLYANTTGNFNIAYGYKSGDNITTGSQNIMIGYNSDAPSATASNQLNIGNMIYGTNINGSGSTISSGNIGIGTTSPTNKLDVNGQIRMQTGATSGYIPVSDASGVMTWTDPATITTSSSAIDDLTDGSDGLGADNVFLGEFSGASNIAGGNNNVGLGIYSLNALTSSNNNTAIGHNSLRNNSTGTGNTAIGFKSLFSNTGGNYNVTSGYNSLYSNTSGGFNVSSGVHSMHFSVNGNDNVATGVNTMYYAKSGNDKNVAIGRQAMQGSTSYINTEINTALGYNSLYNINGGDQNVAIGGYSGDNITTGNRNIMIGYNSDAPSATANYQLNIGNMIYGTNIDGSGSAISSGNIGIGTTSPTNKLDVNGQIRMQTGATSGYIPVSDASGVMTWTDPATISTSTSSMAINDLTDGSDGGGSDNLFLGQDAGASNISGGIIMLELEFLL